MKYAGGGPRLVGPAGYTRHLLSGSGTAVVPLPLKRTPAPEGSPRVEWIAESLKRDALRWLCGYRGGGWRSLQVVVGGRRREGRLWDPTIFPGLGLRFSDAPLKLLVASMESRWSPPVLDPELCSAIRARLAEPDPPTGDLIALHRLHEQIEAQSARPETPACPACGSSLAPRQGQAPAQGGKPRTTCAGCGASLASAQHTALTPRAQRRADLLALSPLTQLFRLQDAGALEDARVGSAAQRIAPLFVGDRAALLSYLAPALARAWIREERRRRRAPVADAQAGYRHTTHMLQAYVEAAASRPDALRPLIAFYADYVLRTFGGRAPVVEALRQQSRVYDSTSERDAFLHDAGGLFTFGTAIQRAVDHALGTAFVDRSEAEKVLLSEYHERFREVAPEVEAIRRELQGELG
jgi:hypothetical protein